VFAGWGSRVARLRWPVLIVALVAVIGSGVWGFGVFGQLTEGGYNDPRSESARAAEMATAATGGQGGDVIAVYTPDQGTIDDAALTKRIKERLAALPRTAVESQTSYWDKKAAAYASEGKTSAVAVITLTGEDDAAKMDAYADIEDALTVPGAHVQLAGGIPLAHASSQRSTDDLAFAEMVSLPIVLILLLLIFGSLVAASLPVLVGGAAVLGSLGVLHAVALTHEVNSFAVNVASLLGLGMAIDYGLFMVGRFREEQAVHHTAEAVRRTVATAGRTVVFSATLLMTALAGLLLFPQGFLKSLAYGGLAAVFLAMVLSLTLLPALLAVLGPRVDLIPIRLPSRGATSTGGWEKLAGWVLRRPVLVAVPIFAALVVLALPIADARFGENDERQLPAGDPSRVAIETLKTDYPQFGSDGVQVVVHATNGKKPDVKAFSAAAAKVTGVEKITTTGGNNKDIVLLTAQLKNTDVFSDEARDAVDGLRALTPPANTELLVGGVTARNVDSLEAIGAELPLMIGLLAGATLVLMFLAFGSILLPIKAVVMSALSLTATFGALVWIFQEGHGASWLDVTPTPLEAGIVVLMAAVVFGLSTDYEVFLLSRMVEARLRGATTREAVTIGLSRTGRVISAAALLLIVVTGAFALSSVTTMRFIGVGMIIALVLDATVVRVLLVPAVLAVLGDASWWAPGPLRRLQEKAGLAEYAGEEEVTGRHAWRPIDPSFEETTVLDGTLLARALPAAPTQAALPSGSETSNTVVLDYEAVLDYLSEKNLSSGTPSDHPIGHEASTSPAEPSISPGDVPDSVSAASGDVPGSWSAVSGDVPDSVSTASGDVPDSLSAASGDVPGSLSAASGDEEVDGEPGGPDDLWAEVEATLAAGAELTKPDTEPSLIEAYADAQSPDDFDPSVTQVLRLPTEPSPDDPSATQVLHLPGAEPAPEEAVIFSETVYNGLFTEETVRAATPAPEPEDTPTTSDALPSADLADLEPVPSSGAEPAVTSGAATTTDFASSDLVAADSTPADSASTDFVPADLTPGDYASTDFVPTDLTPTGYVPADLAPGDYAAAGVESAEPGHHDLESADFVTSRFEAAPTWDESHLSEADFVSRDFAASNHESVDFAPDALETTHTWDDRQATDVTSAGYAVADPVDTDLPPYGEPTAAALSFAEAAPATEPVADPFFWRADPRLANLAAPEPDSFPWLDRYATPPGTPEPAPARPEASLPHPLADRTTGSPRPQTLDDWLATAPRTRPEQPHPYRTDPSSGRPRPDSLADLPTRPTTGEARQATDEPSPSPVLPAEPSPARQEPPSLAEPPSEPASPTTFAELASPATLAESTESPATETTVTEPIGSSVFETTLTEPSEPSAFDTTAPEPLAPATPTLEPSAANEPAPSDDLMMVDEPRPIDEPAPAHEPVVADEPVFAELDAVAQMEAVAEVEPVAAVEAVAEPVEESTEPELTDTRIEPAAEVPTTVQGLEPAGTTEPSTLDASIEQAPADPIALATAPEPTDRTDPNEQSSVVPDPITETPAIEPAEVDAWRDPVVLAQSAVRPNPVVSLPDETPSEKSAIAADVNVTSDDSPADTEPTEPSGNHTGSTTFVLDAEATTETEATETRQTWATTTSDPADTETNPTAPATEPAAADETPLAPAARTTATDEPPAPAEEPAAIDVMSEDANVDGPTPATAAPDVIEDSVNEIFEEPAVPADEAEPKSPVPAGTDRPGRPQTLDEWLSGASPVHRPQTLEDVPATRPRTPVDATATASANPPTGDEVPAARPQTLGDQPTEADRNEPDFLRGRRPETLDDRIRGTVRPATLADHLPDQSRPARRSANTGPSWAGGSGEHPYDRQTRRPASLADHPRPARPGQDPAAEEPGPDAAR
jgi:uncharacterized membrane protein YdfJ with MMPL/SSD domain